MRLQLALNVANLDEAVTYYTKLFATEPHKRRPGYANFAIAEPPLKLVLFENPGAAERLNHLGVETPGADALKRTEARLSAAGILATPLTSTTCCHATQDKLYSHEPPGAGADGGRALEWEWYRITDDAPQPSRPPANAAAGCCT